MAAISNVARSEDKKHGSLSFSLETNRLYSVTTTIVQSSPQRLNLLGQHHSLLRSAPPSALYQYFYEQAGEPLTGKVLIDPDGLDGGFQVSLDHTKGGSPWVETDLVDYQLYDGNTLVVYFGWGAATNAGVIIQTYNGSAGVLDVDAAGVVDSLSHKAIDAGSKDAIRLAQQMIPQLPAIRLSRSQ